MNVFWLGQPNPRTMSTQDLKRRVEFKTEDKEIVWPEQAYANELDRRIARNHQFKLSAIGIVAMVMVAILDRILQIWLP